MYMEARIHKLVKILEQSQKRRGMPLSLHLMARFLLVSIFVIFTTSCSQVQVSPEFVPCNQLAVDCVGVKLRIPLSSLILLMTSPINQKETLQLTISWNE